MLLKVMHVSYCFFYNYWVLISRTPREIEIKEHYITEKAGVMWKNMTMRMN